jgi:hypothetical protein
MSRSNATRTRFVRTNQCAKCGQQLYEGKLLNANHIYSAIYSTTNEAYSYFGLHHYAQSQYTLQLPTPYIPIPLYSSNIQQYVLPVYISLSSQL